jgi:DNA-binding NtrC family response regulator
MIAWAADDVSRIGEVLFAAERGEVLLGRGRARAVDDAARMLPTRQRPGDNRVHDGLDLPCLSRAQARVIREGRALRIENVGRCTMLGPSGAPETTTVVQPGETVCFEDTLLLLCVERPARMRPLRSLTQLPSAFGAPDVHGLVGESAVAWTLRDDLAFLAARQAPVLLLGASGTGKELAARAIHAMSSRRDGTLVARNATTLPSGLIEAELFGNVANYPNAGMPERLGIVGEAEGSTLFLDEIGDLPEALQTRLLRLLDDKADYQRLGEGKRRRANVRFIAATNRDVSALRPDIAARFGLRLTLPTLDARRDDIPLLARHLVRTIARTDPELGARFLDRWDGRTGEPRLGLPLVRHLLDRSYPGNVRDLQGVLWQSIARSSGDVLDLTDDMLGDVIPSAAESRLPTADEVSAALARADGVQEIAWRALGLPNRHVLARLLKKYGIASKK